MSDKPKPGFRHWMEAARLRTLPLSIAGIVTGSALALEEGALNGKVFGLALLTTVLLQLLSNFANDLGDALKGTDDEGRIGPKRAVQSGAITATQMKTAIVSFAIAAFITGSLLLVFAFLPEWPKQFGIFLVIGIGAISAALRYTLGKKPYGYSGKGDYYVIVFFGVVAVAGSYYLYTRQINLGAIMQSIVIGSFSTCVLHLNNMRDRAEDEKHGKRTMAVKLGEKNAKVYFMLLLLLLNGSAILYAVLMEDHLTSWLFLPALIPGWLVGMKVWKNTERAELNNYLKPMALSAFAYSLLFFIGALL